jgi:hypothetical protein
MTYSTFLLTFIGSFGLLLGPLYLALLFGFILLLGLIGLVVDLIKKPNGEDK